jgi:hypothetical protein
VVDTSKEGGHLVLLRHVEIEDLGRAEEETFETILEKKSV